ncbi:MAG: succinate dehydrogenase/fumarate reductase iron-sulfur subunit [Armatimonadetes bacterium]|nr:succinate dehydrogenase/fumarate reductase iron-sulfur subunit [Armatimonadota bacterium]
MSGERIFRVARGGAGETARYQEYRVPEGDRVTVLDGLLHIHRYLDRTLAFRYNCRAMMCGTCGLRVNGTERLACSTRLSAVPGRTVIVEPLRHLPLIQDLMVDFEPFFDAWRQVKPAFVPARAPRESGQAPDESVRVPDEPARIAPDAPERQVIDRHRECISSAICYSACEVVSVSPEFLGPAAMTRALCLITDSRGGAREERLDLLNGERGCWRCHTHTTCSELCPKGLDPTAAIEQVKRILVRRSLLKLVGVYRPAASESSRT